ncbi:MAG: Ig-like domain-containing protein [Kiritimatiellae bacterium]|jgi:hypothetical protein|nr:Ig-like domain-containing protein [Kiritimatiellia bacterium]
MNQRWLNIFSIIVLYILTFFPHDAAAYPWDINVFGADFFSEIDLDRQDMSSVKPLVQSSDYNAALEEWRNVTIDRLRLINWGEMYQHTYQTHPFKRNIAEFLVGYIDETEYTSDYTGFYDIYGMRGSPYTNNDAIAWRELPPDPVPDAYDGVSTSYCSFDFASGFSARYWTTDDSIYLLKWFEIASDFARNQKTMIEALSSAQQDLYDCNWSTDAGPVLGQAGRTKRFVHMIACFAKGLPNGGKLPDWVDSLLPVTNTLAAASYDVIPADELADLALSLVKDHPEALITAYRDPGKTPNQRAEGLVALMFIAEAFPEFIDSPYIFEQGSGGLLDYAQQAFLVDGGMLEQSFNYNLGDARKFYELEPIFASSNGPPWLKALVDAADRFYGLVDSLRTPLGGEPQIGNGHAVIAPGIWEDQLTWDDWLAEQTAELPADAVGLQIYSNVLGQGNADLPAFDSIAFPYSGYYVQRDGWKMDDMQLFFKSSRFHNGHRMLDRNAIQVTAYGRQLLIAAGSPDYFDSLPDGLQDYLAESMHSYKVNTIMVDDLSQQITPLEEIAPATLLNNRFHTSEFFDFVDGEHDTGYGSSDYNYSGTKIKEVRHQRQVWMLRKLGLWIVTDIMINEGMEGHAYTQTWNFLPEYYDQVRPDRDPVRGFTESQVVADIASKRIYTTDDGPNVELRHFGGDDLTYTKYFGDTDPYMGWYARFIADAIPAVDIHAGWTVTGPDTDALVTLIQPSPAGGTVPLSSYIDLSIGTLRGFSASTGTGTNITYLYRPYGALLDAGDVQASAESLLVVDDGSGTLHGAAIGCRYLKAGSYAPVHPAFDDFEFMVDGSSLQLQEISCPDMFAWVTNDVEIAPCYYETPLANVVMNLSASASGDTDPPLPPAQLVSPRQDPTRIWLEWTPVTDSDVCVYEVRSEGMTLRSTGDTQAVIDMLTMNSSYSFTVCARDASGNVSELSPDITVSTTTGRIIDHRDPKFDGLVGYWKFEDDLTDESAYANTGVFEGDPQFVSDACHGKALSFDGTDDLVDLGECGEGLNEQYWNTTALSVMCWAKSQEPTWAEQAPGFVVIHDSLTKRSWGLRPNNSPLAIRADQFYGENYSQTQIIQPLERDIQEWHHYAATYGTRDGASEYRVYADGRGTQIGTWDHLRVFNDPNGAHLIFGRNGGVSYFEYQGLLDEVRIYNVMLTQREVLQLSWYSGDSAPVCNDLSVSTLPGTAVGVVLAATDADEQTLTYAILQPPQHGTLTGTLPNLTYNPDPGFAGIDFATYSACDAYAISSETTISFYVSSGAPATYYWQQNSGTGIWHTASLWDTSRDGGGSQAVPCPADTAVVWQSGVCRVPSTPMAFADSLWVYNFTDPMPELLVDSDAMVVVSNYFRLGSDYGGGSSGKATVKGMIRVLNDNNNGVALGGYDSRHASASGFMTIDGGTFEANLNYLQIGPAGTGAVYVVNGGTFTNGITTRIGSGATPTCQGLFQIDDGKWQTGNSIVIADFADGNGSAVVNGGIVTVGNDIQLGRGYGRFTVNDGIMRVGDYERELIRVGSGSTADAVFQQNGGEITAFGISIRGNNDDGLGNGLTILNNGLMDTVSTHGYWPNLDVRGVSNRFVLAGGTFQGFNGTAHTIWLGGADVTEPNGTLEFRDGTFDMGSNATLFSRTNALVRIIGPLADIDVGWWRHSSWEPYASILELILTQDAGHIAVLKGSRDNGQPHALPGTLRVGVQGGACLLSTNVLPFYWCATTFSHDYYDPESYYDRNIWQVDELSTSDPGGSQLNLVLKTGAACGTINLSNPATISVSDKTWGYVTLNGLKVSAADALLVYLDITPGAKDLQQLVADLQTAGYEVSFSGAGSLLITIPLIEAFSDTAYLMWDFREFDGTVLAAVNAVSVKEVVPGTVLFVQ